MALNSPNTTPANSTPMPSAIQRWRGVYGTGGGCSHSQPIMKTTLNTLRKVDSESTSMPAISATLLNTLASANMVAAMMPGPSSVSRLWRDGRMAELSRVSDGSACRSRGR